MTKTGIQWTDESWNVITGCKECSAGCYNCYAANLAATRLANQGRYKGLSRLIASGQGRWTGAIKLHPDKLIEPYRAKRSRKIFVCDMSDLFYKEVPDEFIDQVFATMAFSPQHTFQLLTKRPARMKLYFDRVAGEKDMERWINAGRALGYDPRREPKVWPLPNVWAGTSIEDQASADERLPAIACTPARVRFLSIEPLLENILLDPALLANIQWAIVGGESEQSGHCRECHVDWIRSVINQCRAASVPVFMKQLGSCPRPSALPSDVRVRFLQNKKGGEPSEWPEDLRIREFPQP